MPDDFVINTKQIGNYPQTNAILNDFDLVLIQRNGLGGPYVNIGAADLVATALANSDDPMMIGGDINVGGDADVGGMLTVGGSVQVNLDALIAGSLQVNGNGSYGINLSVGNDLTVSNAATIGGTLAVDGIITGYNDANFKGNSSIGGNLAVNGQANIGGPVTLMNTLAVAGGASVCGSLHVADDLDAEDATFRGNLAVQGNALVVGNLQVDGNVVFEQNEFDFGSITVDHDGNFLGNVNVGLNLNVTGNSTVDGNSKVGGTLTVSGTSFLQDIAATNLGLTGVADIGGDLSVGGNLCVTGFAFAATPDFDAKNGELVTACWTWHNICKSIDSFADWLFEDSDVFARICSPNFQGNPTAPTPPPGTNDGQIATTAFVQASICTAVAGVVTFNARGGNVVLNLSDIIEAGGAPIVSPQFAGEPTGPTAPPGTNSQWLATTAFVTAAIAEDRATSVISFNGRVGAVLLTLQDIINVGGAPIQSPIFVGNPQAPTPAFDDCSASIATTAFVCQRTDHIFDFLHDLYCEHTVHTFNGRVGDVTLTLNDILGAGGAPIENPQFLGTPMAPTPPPGDNSQAIATTAFVHCAIIANPGPPGIQGPPGPEGPMGEPLIVKGTVPNAGMLPSTGNQVGDIWIASDTGNAWVWGENGTWQNMGPFRGPVGPQGIAGPVGPIGPQGPTGPIGPQGIQGPVGPPIEISGSVTDPSDLPPVGQPGESWLVNGVIYMWDGTDWVATQMSSGIVKDTTITSGFVPTATTQNMVILSDGVSNVATGDPSFYFDPNNSTTYADYFNVPSSNVDGGTVNGRYRIGGDSFLTDAGNWGNCLVGRYAGFSVEGNNAPSYNVAVGTSSLSSLQGTGITGNVAIGANALRDCTNITSCIGIGDNTVGSYMRTNNNCICIGGNNTGVPYGEDNISIGQGAMSNSGGGFANADFQNNIAIGLYCANQMKAGNSNIAIGQGALNNLNQPQGKWNVAIGQNALNQQSWNTSTSNGSTNIAIGTAAMQNTTFAEQCIGIGYGCMGAVTTGELNISIGVSAGSSITTGSSNVIVGGWNSGPTTGQNNTIVGHAACGANAITGSQNVVIGFQNAQNLTTASNEVIIGSGAGYNDETGSTNVFVGNSAGSSLKTGQSNVAIGYAARCSEQGFYNTALGPFAMSNNAQGTNANNNVAIGFNTLQKASTCNSHIAIGQGAGGGITDGSNCIFIGTNAGSQYNGSETANTIIGGYQGVAGESNVIVLAQGNNNFPNADYNKTWSQGWTLWSGSQPWLYGPEGSVFLGSGAGNLTTALQGGKYVGIGDGALARAAGNNGNDVAVGWAAGYDVVNDAGNNVFIGGFCGYTNGQGNITGGSNICFGYYTGSRLTQGGGANILFNSNGPQSGNNNILIGANTNVMTSGSYNVALVSGALQALTTGSNNVAIGQGALPSLTTGSNNICITSGWSGNNYTGNESNNIIIGNPTSVTGENGVVAIGAQGVTFIDFNRTTGGVWTIASGGGNALNIGSGLASMGPGTLNVSSGIYLNGGAYTNPDYVFEHFWTGRSKQPYGGLQPLDEVMDYTKQHHRFPGIHDQPMDIFGRADVVLEKLEEAYLYIADLEHRMRQLEMER